MDSINHNQAELNREDLSGSVAVKKLRDLVKSADTCFFCTAAATGPSSGTRPMSVRLTDEAGVLWFLSASDSHKNKEIELNPNVDLYFQGSAHSEFLHLSGTAVISRDPEKIKELWSPILKTWFTEGTDDPRITVIAVSPQTGYYWGTKHGKAVAGIKMLIGAATGKTLDDSIEGTLSP